MGLGGGRALAGDAAQEAEKLILHGIELRKVRDDEAAAREFQKAYKLFPTPRAAGQLGLAKQALGLWEEAEPFMAEAIRAAGRDHWVTKNRATLDEALGTIQKHLGRVEVIGDPQGAEVSINGRRVGTLPLPEAVHVSAGQVDIDVHAAGYAPTQRTVTLIGGQYQRVVIHLGKVEAPKEAEAPKVSVTSRPPEPDPQPEIGAKVTAPPPQPVADEGGTSRTRVALKWTAAGLAGVGLLTGTVGAVLHSNKVSEFDNHPCRNKDGAGVLVDGTPDSTCQSLLDSFRADQKIAIVGFVAAGAFAATWLALFLTEPSPAARPNEQAFCAPTATGFGFSCALRF